MPARRAITIRDLLAHKSGITYGFLNGGAVGGGYRKNGVTDGLTTTTMTLEEGDQQARCRSRSSAQPGAAFNYSLSTDVLGRVVEVVSGQPFNVFLRERIFKPLEDERHRLHRARREVVALRDGVFAGRQGRHSADDRSGIVRQHAHVAVGVYKEGRTYFSGGAGPRLDGERLRAFRATCC